MNNIPSTTLKSTGFATILFWLLISTSERMGNDVFLLILISTIPIIIICLLAITFTTMPFYWLEKNKLNSNQIFNKYFPYYSIMLFGICSYFIVISNFESFVVSFFITAFFTASQTWIWIFKLKKNEIL